MTKYFRCSEIAFSQLYCLQFLFKFVIFFSIMQAYKGGYIKFSRNVVFFMPPRDHIGRWGIMFSTRLFVCPSVRPFVYNETCEDILKTNESMLLPSGITGRQVRA